MKNILLFILTFLPAFAQAQVIRGLVVDSLTLESLPGVTIRVGSTSHGSTSNSQGIFVIEASPKDTLIFSSIGYTRVTLHANPDEEIMFVKMREETIILDSITVTARSLKYIPDEIYSPTLSTTKPLTAGNVAGPAGAPINLDYFGKREVEKRKLVITLRELARVKVYTMIVNDPAFRREILDKYSLSEQRYYDLLAIFNQKFQDVIRSGDQDRILHALDTHFSRGAGK